MKAYLVCQEYPRSPPSQGGSTRIIPQSPLSQGCKASVIPQKSITGGSCHKHHFCCAKVLSRQTCVCCNKRVFVATKHVLLWQIYACRNKNMLQQTSVCRDKTFVAANICFNKHNFVPTSILLSWLTQVCLLHQNYVCHDKYLSQQNIFVMTKLLLWQTYFCSDKRHVLSKQTRVCRNKNDTCGSSRQW